MRKRLFILSCQPILRKINFCFLTRYQLLFDLLYLILNFLIDPDDIRQFVSKILHGDISCIFYPRHAGLKHRKARLHEENEYRSYHNPYRTDCTIFHHDSSLISVISVLPCDSEPYVPVIPLSPPGAPSCNVHPHIYSVYRTDIPASALPDQVYHLA